MIAYYTGCWGRPGIVCRTPDGWQPFTATGHKPSPWASGLYPVDDSLCQRELGYVCGGPKIPQPEGVWRHIQRDGWTMLSSWDRSVDPRDGSHASFVFDALLTADEAEAEARRLFPAIWARIDAHLRVAR